MIGVVSIKATRFFIVLLGSAEATLQIVNSHRYRQLELKVLGHQVKTKFLWG
jgi:hypothetical protein